MKNNWQTKKLREIIELKYGKGIGRHERHESADYPVYGANGVLGRTDKAWTSGEAIIVGRKGSAGEITRVSGKFWPSDVTYYVFGNDHINIDYLFYFFLLIDLRKLARGVKPGINRNDVYQINIPLPSLEEQQKIIKILDEIFEKIEKAKENTEKNLQNSRELFESHLLDIFKNNHSSLNKKNLGEIVKTTQGIQIPKNMQKTKSEEGYKRYLYISDFDHDKNLKYIEDKYPSKIVTKNDLIVVNTGATAGKIYRGIEGILSNNLFKVSFDTDLLDIDYLYYFVTSSIFKNFQKKILRGTANPHMGHENFNSTPFSLPTISEQKTIVKKLDELSEQTKKLEEIYTKKLADLEELKKSVLQKAFAGEL